MIGHLNLLAVSLAVLACAFAVGGAVWWLQERRRHALRSELTQSIGDLRAERDAAILAVRWVPMQNHEFAALSKSGCSTCHGLGYIKGSATVKGVDGKLLLGEKGEPMVRAFTKVCTCVAKAMGNNPKYGAVADGIPVRLATKEEIAAVLAEEARQAAGDREPAQASHGYDNVVPITSAK